MRVTVLLRNGDSWRIPVKSPTADVRWLVDEVARRLKRRVAEPPPTPDTESSGDGKTNEVGNIVGVRRATSAILELDDKLFDHCVDGEVLTAIYVSERELVDGFTDLIRSLHTGSTAATAAAAAAAAADPAVGNAARFGSITPLGTPVKSAAAAAAAAAPEKLPLDSTDDSSERVSMSAARRLPSTMPRTTSLVDSLLRSASLQMAINVPETGSGHVLSVIASTEGDRVDVSVDAATLTAKDVIREVLLNLYGQLDERRHYGLATLDGALLGPAMPIVELFRSGQRRVRVVLVFPPDDDSETEVSESLGVAFHDVQTVKSSLQFGQPRRPSSPEVESCLTEDSSDTESSSSADVPLRPRGSSPLVKRSSKGHRRAKKPAADPLLLRAAADIAQIDAVIQATSQPTPPELLKKKSSSTLATRQHRSNSGGTSMLERKRSGKISVDSESSALTRALQASPGGGSGEASSSARVSGSASRTPTASPSAAGTAAAAAAATAAATATAAASPSAPLNTSKGDVGGSDDGDGTAALLYLQAPFEEVEICEFLGKGGSTSVFRGVVRGLSVAVKVFDLSFSDRQDRESVQREIGFMQTLRHRHIIGFLGVHQVDKTIYLYMEYFMATLHHLITKRRDSSAVFDVMEVSTFALQIARALKYLHTRSEPIIHRDLKSENVFIYRQSDKQYVVKLGDFGESTTVERKSIFHQRLKRSVCNVGTTEFRAPELWGAKAKGYNTKIDIWAFGMVLFELLTLDIPYRREGINRFAIPAYIADGNRPQLPPSLPIALAPIVKLFNRCSEASPSARPTAKELVASLDKLNRIFG